MAVTLRTLAQEIDEKVQERLARNIWFFSADSATSRDHRFFTIDATNENDETLRVKTCYSSWEKQDAAWIKSQLRSSLQGVSHLAGLSQDTAAVCKAAFRQLHNEIGDQHPRCFYINCNEHVSQLLNQDLSRALPWLKDAGSGGCGSMNPFFGRFRKGFGTSDYADPFFGGTEKVLAFIFRIVCSHSQLSLAGPVD